MKRPSRGSIVIDGREVITLSSNNYLGLNTHPRLREAAEPHLNRGKRVAFAFAPLQDGVEAQPSILRRPEIIHGLRNLVQNAVDFARSSVWVEGEWTSRRIIVRITDDGDGFPAGLIGRIGDPFVRARRAGDAGRGRDQNGGKKTFRTFSVVRSS